MPYLSGLNVKEPEFSVGCAWMKQRLGADSILLGIVGCAKDWIAERSERHPTEFLACPADIISLASSPNAAKPRNLVAFFFPKLRGESTMISS
jgi:hypothetical protein